MIDHVGSFVEDAPSRVLASHHHIISTAHLNRCEVVYQLLTNKGE
jgi:hypothetical protein